MNSVQIPNDLWKALITYFMRSHLEDWEAEQLKREIQKGLQSKLDSLLRRQLFTRYKRAATPEERESARIAYLDEIGMRENFRSPTPPDSPL